MEKHNHKMQWLPMAGAAVCLALVLAAAGIAAGTRQSGVAHTAAPAGMAATGTQMLYGSWDGVPLLWRVVAADEESVTLFCQGDVGTQPYDTRKGNGDHGQWSESRLCHWLNSTHSADDDFTGLGFLATAFSTAERGAMVTPYSTVAEEMDGVQIVPQQTVVLPSYEEVLGPTGWGLVAEQLSHPRAWFLRTPGNFAAIVYFMQGQKPVAVTGCTNTARAIRPVFRLALSRVVLYTAAKENLGDDGAAAVGDRLFKLSAPGGTARLTMLDDAQPAPSVSCSVAANGQLAMAFSGAESGPGRYLSCVVRPLGQAASHYARLAQCDAAGSGTAGLSLESLAPGRYSLAVFAEQINPGAATNQASQPVTFALRVEENGQVAVQAVPGQGHAMAGG